MKKRLLSFLIMTLVATSCSSLVYIPGVHAATTNDSSTYTSDDGTIKISLENIREIMLENNLDIKIQYNQVKKDREAYDDAKSDYEAKGSAKTAAENALALNPADTSAQATLATAESNLTASQKSLDNARKTLDDDKNAQAKKIEDEIYSAQQAFITYLSDLDNEKLQGDTATQNQKKQQIYKLQYDSGFISKNKYTQLIQADTSTNDLDSAKNTSELDKIKLLNLLGIGADEQVTFETDLNKDFDAIATINYDDDLSKMLENNTTIQDDNDRIDELKDEDNNSDSHDYDEDTANMTLTKDMNDAETDFKNQYNDLMSSYNSIKSSYDVINQEQKEFQITQTKYDYGFISKNDLDAAKITLDSDNAKFTKNRNQCYLKYLKYIEMKEGY